MIASPFHTKKRKKNKMLVNADYQKKLLKKWGMILESGNKISTVQDKLIVAQVLENTHRFYKKLGFFTEATNTVNPTITPNGAYDVSNGILGAGDYILPNVVMPMLRRIFPTLMAHELVGVQPMTSPIGYALALRAQGPNGSNSSYGKEENYEYGFEATAGTTGKKVATDAPFSRRGEGIRGTGRGTTEGEGFGEAPAFGRFGPSGVPGTYPQSTINFVKKPVTAETRKLGSEWSSELAEDLEAMHGIDIETEMVNLLSFQIGSEIDQQILDAMVDAGAKNETVKWNAAEADGLDQMGRIATLLTTVTKAANDISVTTRRGPGNFVVASVNVASAIQQLGSQKLVTDGKTMPSVPASSVGALSKEGLVNDGRQLLVRDSYATVDYALVGYKGTHPGDSGIIYCPYVPVTLVKTVDPYTLSPRIGARTRYGLLDNPFDAQNFYRVVECKFDGVYQLGSGNRYFFGSESGHTIAQSISISGENAGEGSSAAAEEPSGAPAKKVGRPPKA